MKSACIALLILLLTLGLLVASSATAQDRPSLERLEAAICAKADADGDSYRPNVCDPRCDCLSHFLPAPIVSCSEVAPGRFELGSVVQGEGSCIPVDFGQGPEPLCFAGPCGIDDACPAGYGCLDHPLLGKSCYGGICAGNGECPSFPLSQTAVLEDVVPVTNDAVVQCTPPGVSTVKINSTDANECLVQAEAASGLDCGFRCGNGLVDAAQGETCDDGNQTAGDGCDASCQVE